MYQNMGESYMFRRFFIQKYVIIYRIKENIIWFERILPSNSNYNQKDIYKIKFPIKIKIEK